MLVKAPDDDIFQYLKPCYTAEQIYHLEKQWFKKNDSFGLMQQAGWQIANWLQLHYQKNKQSVLIVVGSGNNGGDGWVVATFLRQLCPHWNIQVLEVEPAKTANAQQAKALFQQHFLDMQQFTTLQNYQPLLHFDIIIDALFGIGLNKQPTGNYQTIIEWINKYKQQFNNCQIISIDTPSGLNASTGEVYQQLAIKANITLCLLARKVGLHLQFAKDFVGKMVDLPLIPTNYQPIAYHIQTMPTLPKRSQISYKGTYGHLLIIGGNQLDNGQGMAGASLLTAMSAFAVGVGKVSVACHANFHASVIAKLPNAMTVDLQQQQMVIDLIRHVDVVAIGMGLGRDNKSQQLFNIYLRTIIQYGKKCVIDADGLYHLAELANSQNSFDKQLLKDLLTLSDCYFTPHAGEAGFLLNQHYSVVDKDKLTAIQQLSDKYGGHWLIKGADSVIWEQGRLMICDFGNAGMATAGMGDSLAGVVAGLLAQNVSYPLTKAVCIHAKAGDNLAKKVGEYGVQAHEMATMIAQVLP